MASHDIFKLFYCLFGCGEGRARLHFQNHVALTHVGQGHHFAADEVVETEADHQGDEDAHQIGKTVDQEPAYQPLVAMLQSIQSPLNRQQQISMERMLVLFFARLFVDQDAGGQNRGEG